MRYYIPRVVKNWGDGIVAVWIAQYISEHFDIDVTLDPIAHSDKATQYKYTDWLEFGFKTETLPLMLTNATVDKVVATHHRHDRHRTRYASVRPELLSFWDAHGFTFRMVVEGWYPELNPTQKLLQQFYDLNLPTNYTAIHLNEKYPDDRSALTTEEFLARHSLPENMPIVSTGSSILGTIDLASIEPWLKIYVMYRSHTMWGSMSGFTSIPSIYRRRVRTSLVNDTYPRSLNYGPPAISYGNYEIANEGSRKELYYAIESGIIKNASGRSYLKRSQTHANHWCQFETFDFSDDINVPEDYVVSDLYDDIENCLVPLDAKFTKNNSEITYDFRNKHSQMCSKWSGWSPRVINYYVPCVAKHWGDNITGVWVAQYLTHKIGVEAIVDTTGYNNGKPLDHSEWINTGVTNRSISLNDAQSKFGRLVSTHHRHGKKRTMYPGVDPSKLTFFDAHGLIYKFVTEDWYPEFSPTATLLAIVDSLKLPKEYVSVHLNDNLSDGRNVIGVSELLKTLSFDLPIVSTGAHIEGAINLQSVDPWTKICVMVQATKLVASLSGFTSIASIYRRRKNVELVNDPYPASLNLGPPSIAYGNHEIVSKGSLRALYSLVESGKLNGSSGRSYFERSHENDRHWCQFETLEVEDFAFHVPDGYEKQELYHDIENCLVPLDATYRKTGTSKCYDYRIDDEMCGLRIMAWTERKR